jgi:DNA repair protein RadC
MDQRIMDLPENERPQERLLKYGPQCLSNSELLAVILRSGNKNEGITTLSVKLISEFGGLNNLLDATWEELGAVSGIKEAKASTIIAIGEIVKRYRSYRSGDEYKISTPNSCADLLMNEMRELKKEILKVIILNTKNCVIGIKEASVGSLNSSIVHPREIFRDAIRKGAASIIMVHNHPSGDPTPSGDDINSTKRIVEAGKIIGIELLDHIIIGEGKFISLREKGFM